MGNGVANENTLIGGAAASAAFKIYLATTALGGTALSGGATGLIIENGSTTATTANKLENSTASFTSAVLNKTVYNTTDKTWAKITAVDSGTVLSLSADIMASGETYDIADAVDDLEDAYSVLPASFGVNITIVVSNGTHTYAGAVTLSGKGATGSAILDIQGATTTPTIESTTTTTLTFGDAITIDDITFSDSIITDGAFIGTTIAFGTNLTGNSILTITNCPITGNLTTNGVSTITTSDTGGNLVSTDTITLNNSDVTGTVISSGSFTNTTDIIVGGNATFTGPAILATATFSSALITSGAVINTTSLDITGNWVSSGVAAVVDVSVGGNLTASAQFNCTTDLDVTGDIIFTAQATIAGTITCDNITTSGGLLTQTGSLDVTTDATFSAESIIDTVTVGGDMVTNAKMTQTTSLDVTGNLTTNAEAIIDTVTVTGSLISTGKLTQTSSLDVTTDMTTSGASTVDTVTVGGNLITNSGFTQTTTLDVTGTWDSFGTTTGVGLTIGGTSDFSGSLAITGTNVFNGDVYARAVFNVLTTTFNRNVYAEFGCGGIWDTCTITSPYKLYIQSDSTSNTITDSTLTIANNPVGVVNVNSTLTVGYTIYTAPTGYGGDDSVATGLSIDSSTTTSTTSNKLVDSGAAFTSAIHLNKSVYNSTDDTWAKITAVDSATTLSLSADIMVSGDSYSTINAYSTISGAWDFAFPGTAYCDITLHAADGSYSDELVITGKSTAGAYTLTLKGSTSGTTDISGEVSLQQKIFFDNLTFTKRVFEYFGADIDWTTCVTSGDDGFIITKSTSIANIFRSSSVVVFESDPGSYVNIDSTVTVGYTLYVAIPALGGSDATNDGLLITQGSATSTTGNKLVDSTANFTTAKHDGKTIYNSTNDTWAEITAVDSGTTLSLDTDIMTNGESYTLVAAKSTIQSGVDAIPGGVNCNTTVKISDDTFAEEVSIFGKTFSGSFTITLEGTLVLQESVTSATVSAGSGATQGVATKVGAFAGDSYGDYLCYFVTDEVYRVIDSHTNDALTLVGTAASSTAQDIKILRVITTINGSGALNVTNGQQSIFLVSIDFESSVSYSSVTIENNSTVTMNNCRMSKRVNVLGSNLYTYDSYIAWGTVTDRMLYVGSVGNYEARRTKHATEASGKSGIVLELGSTLFFQNGSILDGFDASGPGIKANTNASLNFWSSSANGYARIRNCSVGLTVDSGAQAIWTQPTGAPQIVYSGNTADRTENTAKSAHYTDTF